MGQFRENRLKRRFHSLNFEALANLSRARATLRNQLRIVPSLFNIPTIMSKAVVPSSRLLSSFSSSISPLKRSATTQCSRISTFSASASPRASQSPAQCLRRAISNRRAFATSPQRQYKTVQEQRSRYRSGVSFPPSHSSFETPPRL
jgi:hypothetical protein